MSILELSSKEIVKQFDLFSKTSSLDENFINFLKNINLIQKKYYSQLEENFVENYAKKIQKKVKINQDPLLARKDFCYDEQNSEAIFKEILELMLKENNHLQAVALEINNQLSNESLKIKQIFDNFLKEKQNFFIPYIKLFNTSPSIMFFLAYNSLLPSILHCSKVVIDYSNYDLLSTSQSKACPVCASVPYIASLGEKKANSAGEQYNHCSFCHTKYRAKRLQCSFCQCEDHTKLGFYSIDEFPDIQIHICNECHNYIKLQETPSLSPLELIDNQSLSLDIAMQNESFTRPSPIAFHQA